MVQIMRHAGGSFGIIRRAGFQPQHMGDDRSAMRFHHHDAQAVFQGKPCDMLRSPVFPSWPQRRHEQEKQKHGQGKSDPHREQSARD
jgi:hypothetical protein